MIFIDTGYLIAIVRKNDELHARAMAWSREIHYRLIISEYILCEAMNNLSSGQERETAHWMLTAIMADNNCQIIYSSPELFDAGVELHRQRHDKNWSLTDCISFHIMRDHNISAALAHDHHFEQAGFEALLRRDP